MNTKHLVTLLLLFLSSTLYLSGFLVSFPYLIENLSTSEKWDTLRNMLEYLAMFTSLIVFCALLLRSKWTKFFAYFFVLFLSLNFLISVSCYYVYSSGFNIGMAVSLFDTNINEASNMKGYFIIPVIIAILFFILITFTIQNISRKKLKPSLLFYILSSIWILLPITFKLKHQLVSNKGGGSMWKNVYYHLTDLQIAYNLREDYNKINTIKPKFHLEKQDEGVQNVILVIGESAKRDRHSLYGYQKNTTPNQNKEIHQMMLYTHAVSPAGITNLSVPLILSSINPVDFKEKYQNLAYNLINLANQTEYNTYWISTQAAAKSITTIAANAKNKKWIDGYDENILPYFNDISKKQGKKFIVLHINGSHPDPCTKFPNMDKDPNMDCYDNSIKYTDKILGQLFNTLQNTNSILIYTSDHALKIKQNKYIHTDSKESTQVPLYVWHSNKVSENYAVTKKIDSLTQNTIIFPLVMQYMGFKPPVHYKNKNFQYLQIDLNTTNYDQLKN